MQQFLSQLSRRARIGFVACVMAILTIGVTMAWVVLHPPYGLLFRDLKEADAADITSALTQMQVSYRITDGGHTIMVPDALVYDMRMKLVSQGIPKSGSVGFEQFKDSDYGVTEFAQRVNFQRAIQGELERTIDSMSEIASSRVHLTIKRQDLFARDGDASKAAVTLQFKPDSHLEARQVAGIQRLVAAAVEGLSPAAVVILDGNGAVLSGRGSEAGNMAGLDRWDEQAKLELQLRQKVSELLRRVIVSDEFTVSVDVQLNYDRVKQTREQLISQGKDGNGLILREKTGSTGRTIDEGDGDRSRPSASSSDHEIEYAHGREQQEIIQEPGRVERISVGIVVPDSLPQSQLGKLADVVKAGLGLDSARGDKVDIASIAPLSTRSTVPDAQGGTSVAGPIAATGADNEIRKATSDGALIGNKSLIWLGVASAAVCLLIAVVWVTRASRRQPRRLSPPEREEALQRLREWITAGGANP